MVLNKARSIITVFAFLIAGFLHAQKTETKGKGWSVHHPFEHDVFIENKGQFIEQVQKGVGSPILYYSHKGHIHIYFTETGITFEHDSAYMADGGDDKGGADDDAKVEILPIFMHMTWADANANAKVEVQNPVTTLFTYPNPKDKGHSGITANAWEKIIYHNLYNNIDVVFYYSADKKGLEYDITVHPGGDLSKVKMLYSSNANLQLINKTIHISSSCFNFSDKEPNAKDENGNIVAASFSLHNNVVSFTAGNYDKSKTLVIDPMFTSTTFTGSNKAYDVQYDLAGNMYACGGGDATEYQVLKYSPTFALLWTYTATFTYNFKSYYYYGGFTTDNRSGSSYIAEGLDYGGKGCQVVKIATATGLPAVTFAGSTTVNEIWRLSYDYCDNQLIIGAGEGPGAGAIQGATLDTNLTTATAVNVLGAPGGSSHHDIAMITFDGVGKCYFATTKPAAGGNAGYYNVLLQMPSAALAPTAYQVADHSVFIETASVPYYPALPSNPYLYSGNGFNGLIADLNFVATYDGNKLRTWTPATGAAIDSVTVSPNVQMSGGIALDCEDNFYVGNGSQISVYSSALGLINTITPTGSASTDTLYDLHLAPNNMIYAGGNDYVSVTPVTLPKMVTVASPSTSCGCTGTATATVCDNYPYTYSWSNGQTTQTATGLCPGKYLVTIKDQSCNPRIDTASVDVSPGAGYLNATIVTTPVKCFGQSNGTASVTVIGGTAPIVYSWSNGATSSTINALAAGNYTCTVKDANGCTDTLKDSVQTPKPLTVKATTFPATCSYKCDGQAIAVPSGGTNPYAYTWSGGGSGASVNNLCVGAKDSVTVTDAHGCVADTTVKITDPPPITYTTDSTAALCGKASGSACLITVSGGTPGYTYSWNTGATTSCLNNVNADVYQVTITDANTCTVVVTITVPTISGDSAKIVSTVNELCFGGNNGSATATVWGGTAPYTYTWQTTTPTQTSLTATGLVAGTYTFSVTDANGCIYKTYATITQPTPVNVIVPPDTICIGQTGTLTATASGGTPPYTYLWNSTTTGATFTANPKVTTSYSVVATDSNGCTAQYLPTLVVRAPLIVVAGPKTSMCPGKSAALTATGAGGDGIYTYTWAPATGLNPTTGTSVMASPTVTTVYTVTITDACGTPQAVDSVPVIVYPLPVVNLVADTLQGCTPLCVDFTNKATVTGGTIATSYWTFGDGGSSSDTNPKHCYTKAGVFSVSLTVTSNEGCSATDTIDNYITTYSHPIANFTYSPQPAMILDPTIYFTDHSTDAYGIVNWFWQFGDGADSAGLVKNPQHTYADTGWYCVNLKVTNTHGCVADTVQCIYIEPYFTIYVPNAFTPNSNGLNDYFTAKGVGILQFQMWIFDRWGQQLYYTTQMNPGWNGVVQGGTSGAQAQEDTYVWLIEVTDVFHKAHRLVGRVTLIK